jgi:hypothetical protein
MEKIGSMIHYRSIRKFFPPKMPPPPNLSKKRRPQFPTMHHSHWRMDRLYRCFPVLQMQFRHWVQHP